MRHTMQQPKGTLANRAKRSFTLDDKKYSPTSNKVFHRTSVRV